MIQFLPVVVIGQGDFESSLYYSVMVFPNFPPHIYQFYQL